MQNKSFKKKLCLVAFSRLVSLTSSIFVGFLLPKIFSIIDYGFYKIFTLYAVYTALFHFGFVDGILLKIAGKDYNELEFPSMRTYTQFFMVFEVFISIIMMLLGFMFTSGEYLFIVFMLALNMIFVNLTTYYQFISQAVQRFGEYSAKSLIVSVVKILFVSGLFIGTFFDIIDVSYRIYLLGLNVLDFLVMLWYVIIYSDITFGTKEKISVLKNNILYIFKTGIILTLAYQISHLVLALDRQFVNVLFSTEVFAIYSFAYNMVSMISTMISSISIVLLPMLKKSTEEIVIISYKKSSAIVAIAAAVGLMCYYPLASFIEWFLPDYKKSIEYIAVVLPAFLFTAVITVVMFTVVKVLDKTWEFFKDSCVALVLGGGANAVAYTVFKSPKSISYASLIVMEIWFVITGLKLKKNTGVGIWKEFSYLVIISCGFLITTVFVDSRFLGFLIYFIWLFVWTIIVYLQKFKEMVVVTMKKNI